MKIVYSKRYLSDFYAIMDYVAERNPQAASRVSSEIDQTIDQLIDFPLSGQPTAYLQTRRIVTPKYGYLIYYSGNSMPETLEILTIAHGRQERPFEDG